MYTSEDGHSSKYSANLFVCEKNTLWANQFLTFLLDLKWQFSASYQSLAAPLQGRWLILLSLLGEGFSILFTSDLISLLWFTYFYCILFPNLRNIPKTPTREWADRSCITKAYIYITINMFSGCSSTYLSAFLVWNPTLNRNLEASSVLIIARFSMSCVWNT